MYLPVILIRELGGWGLLAFAIPNVLGAAAFGYVLRGRAGSVRVLERHRPAARWFSITAIAFHAYFVAYLTTLLAPSPTASTGPMAATGVLAAALLLCFLPTRVWPIFAGLVFTGSLVTLAVIGLGELSTIPATGLRNPQQAAWLAPVLFFGFLLCPYLDLTFHRTIREAPSRHAFAVFGVAFSLMLVLTCVYRDHLALAIVPFAHIIAQSVFTIAAHLRELHLEGGDEPRRNAWLALVLAVPAMLLPLAGGEDVYLRFLAFYGLIFPAWVVLFVGPGRRPALTPKILLAYAGVMLVSLPFYELGFIHGHMWLVPIPVAAIILWAAIASRRGQ
jgi:hypothetical protein